jgi:hypothetical protein
MSSLDETAPLSLLTTLHPLELADILRVSVAANAEMTLTQVGPANGTAFEIAYCGVTYLISITERHNSFAGLKEIFCNIDLVQIRSALNVALGAHVAGGERVPSIIRTLLDLGRKVGISCSAVAAVWRPANVVSGFDYFEQAVKGYLMGGAFPVLAMVNFRSGPDRILTTNGLAALSGQELQIGCESVKDAEIMRRAVRVVHDLAVNGPVLSQVRLDGLDPGEKLDLDPVSSAGLLKMTICSVLDA